MNIGFLTAIPDGWGFETRIHPDCKTAVEDAAGLCENLGHHVREVNPTELGHPGLYLPYGRVFTCLTGHFFAYWEKELGKKITKDRVEPMTWASYQAGLKRTGADYLSQVEELQRFSRKIGQWYHQGGYDLLLTPTLSLPPTPLGSFHPTSDDPRRGFKASSAFVAFTFIQNITGQPAMSVPLYWNGEDLPIGVQFAGRYGDEATLYRLAAQLEKARPWAGRKPPIHCG